MSPPPWGASPLNAATAPPIASHTINHKNGSKINTLNLAFPISDYWILLFTILISALERSQDR